MAAGSETRADPWQLKIPPGTSDRPAILGQVGPTQLKYDKRAIDDHQAMLKGPTRTRTPD